MRFVVVGTGAIGGVVGGKLLAAGHDVVLVARGAQFAAIRERGLRIESPVGPTTVSATMIVDRVDAVDWRPDDVALVAVKTQDVAAALAPIGVDVTVACLTNGVEAERIALRRFSRVLGISVVSPASFLVPGIVELWSAPVAGTLDLGAYPHGSSSLARELSTAFESAGFSSLVRDDIMRWKRGKLLANLGNAAEALTTPAARTSAIAKRARAEGLACYAAAGLSTISDDEDAARRSVWKLQPIAGRTRSGGSTWQSLARGTGGVECDYLNGEIVLLGREHGVPTPVNAALQRLVADAARTGSPPGSMTLDELDRQIG